MGRELVTRSTLTRALVLNASRSPLAIGVGLLVFAAGLALGTWWLLPLAVVVYTALAAATFFDGDVAQRVGERRYARSRPSNTAERTLPSGLSEDLTELLERARREERLILDAIEQSDLPFEEISVEVDGLTQEMGRIAVRAQTVTVYLQDQDAPGLRQRLAALRADDPTDDAAASAARIRAAEAIDDQLRVGEALESELRRFRAEMEHLIASLGVVHGQLVRISVSHDPQLEEDVAREVRDLRTRVGSLADGLHDADRELRKGPG